MVILINEELTFDKHYQVKITSGKHLHLNKWYIVVEQIYDSISAFKKIFTYLDEPSYLESLDVFLKQIKTRQLEYLDYAGQWNILEKPLTKQDNPSEYMSKFNQTANELDRCMVVISQYVPNDLFVKFSQVFRNMMELINKPMQISLNDNKEMQAKISAWRKIHSFDVQENKDLLELNNYLMAMMDGKTYKELEKEVQPEVDVSKLKN